MFHFLGMLHKDGFIVKEKERDTFFTLGSLTTEIQNDLKKKHKIVKKSQKVRFIDVKRKLKTKDF